MTEIEVPHPREVYAFEHGEAAEQAFLTAMDRNRLHHGWLLVGPEGVGKATFAWRAARRLLGAAADPAFGLLGASPNDPISRLIASRAHPDLMALERESGEGRARKVISVDEARRLPEFFSKAPSMAAWRVAIVDSVDDMNPNAANALLKILEEPPDRGLLFLVSHAPGGLLDTIRSRCRRLKFSAWSEEETADFVRKRGDMTEEDALRLSRMAGGAPGMALDLAARGALDTDKAARALMQRLPDIDSPAAQILVDGFRGAEGGERFVLAIERLADQARQRAERAAEEGARDSERWADAWAKLADLPGEVEGLNLDRGDAFWTALGVLRAAAGA